jgi:hypothetical protein
MVLSRCLLSLSVAAALIPAIRTSAEAQGTEPADTRSAAQVEDDGDGGGSRSGWRAVTGLRLEQWIAPARDHLRFDVRLSLPEMALGRHVSIETFNWERLDVAEGRSERGDNGTVYQLLGARYRRESGGHAFFIGAHALSWSGHARPLVPWVGLRLGERGGMSIAAEGHLLGLGPHAGEMRSPLDEADFTIAVDGPRIGACRIGARGRARDVHHPDRHQREQMISLGVEFGWGRRRMFVGVGIQHQFRRAAADADDDPTTMPPPISADRMPPAASRVNVESTAVMLHLDAETPLPRSLLGP